MLSYTIDYADPAKDVSNGVHSNPNDDPVDFPFSRDHTKGASSATIRSDINTYLGQQSRTGYDPAQKYVPAACPDGLIIKDTTDGTTAWKIKVSNAGEISTENVTQT